ncbi:MAG: GIY-YIG nuclease family protein [Candidatus Niyogibacteria bacterium]|nr:MAG: GIY-YIG nuclease family protein [Candidatus Niyogibacteria bacterium]
MKNTKNDNLYFGYTSDLKKRFTQHNSNEVLSTKNRGGWQLVYYEAYCNENNAKHREYSIKLRGNAYLQLKRRIKGCIT